MLIPSMLAVFSREPCIELERHLDVLPLLVADEVVELLTDSPFGIRRLLKCLRFMEHVGR